MSKITSAAIVAALLADTRAGINLDTGSGYQPGQMYQLANDSRFVAAHFNEPLTTYAVGWRDRANLEAELEFLAPECPVPRRFSYKKATNAEEFLSEIVDDVRAIGSDFKRIQFTGTEVESKTLNKGLMYVVDLDEVAPGTNWEQDTVARILRRLQRNELRRAQAGLTAAATNTNKTWNSSADPDQDVADDLVTSGDATGISPNRVAYGLTAWNTRRRSYRAQNNAGSDASAKLNPDELAAQLMVDGVHVSRARYQSSASAKTQILATKVLMFMAESGLSREEPSNIKRFVTPHDAEQGGGRYQVFRQQLSAKLVGISVSHYSQIVVTSTTGIRQFTVAAS